MAVSSLLLTSCHTAKESVAVNENAMNGEWNIVEIQGNPVQAESQPFIGFDTKEGRVYGNSGCNQMMGAFTFSAPNHFELGDMASTMRACPDMDTENQVLSALNQVCAYGMLANGHLALMAEGSTVVLELERSK